MSDDRTNGGPPSWLERLSQALLGEPKDRHELIGLLRDAEQRRLLDADVLAMIEGAIQVAEMRVRDIMVPRVQAVMLERDAPLDDILETVIESAHSRFPVLGDSPDDVVGILLAKDILPYLRAPGDGRLPIRDVLRPAVFIPESKRLNVLLREFRASRNHMAIVVDEYGGVSGLVTIEDVLEQIVGDIDDEHDVEDEETFIRRHSDTLFTVKALTPVEDFNDMVGANFDDDEFDTIGGHVLRAFAHMPERGEEVYIGNLRFEVLKADGRRIHLVKVERVGEGLPE